MNIIETQARHFFRDYDHCNTDKEQKSSLEDKLYLFKRDRDKLDFLKTLHQEIKIDIQKHESKCNKEDCHYATDKEFGIFLINQEIDSINEYYTFEPKNEDKFSTEEETSLHIKLNEIIDRLNKQDLGQEILFEEIESLKNHFNLGKKTWFQLLKGKMIDVTIEKGIELTVVAGIYEQLSEGFAIASKWLK
jgi:hypothetical protein